MRRTALMPEAGTMSTNARSALLAALLIAGAGGTAAGAADAAPKQAPTGTWAGTATYVSPEDGPAPGVEYRSAITITTRKERGGVRVTSLYATVRTYCLSGIRDIRLLESRRSGRGPLVGRGGGFSFAAKGATIRGNLDAKGGRGTIVASAGGCDLQNGSFTVAKRRF